VVEILPAVFEDTGISEEGLKTQVELYLRKSGLIEVKDDSFPYVYVRLNGAETGLGGIAFSLELKVGQPVFLQRINVASGSPRAITCSGSTLHSGFLGICPRDRIRARIQETLKELLEGFANDYMKENPKAKWGGKE